jgi:hypothetical protein
LHGLISFLTAALLLAHTVLGCCSHHAHGSDGPAAIVCCEEQRQENDGSRCDHSHKRDANCQGSKCAFVRPAKVQVGDLEVAPQLVCAVSSPGDPRLILSDSPAPLFLMPHGPVLPVRLHLMNQVLLL